VTVRFYIRSKNKNANIHVSVSLPGNIKYRKKTGLLIDPNNWDAKKQLPDRSTVSNKNLGLELIRLRNRISEAYNQKIVDGGTFDPEWFDSVLYGKTPKGTVLQAIEGYIANSHRIKGQKDTGLSIGRVRIYEVFKRMMEDFSKDWKVSEVSPETVGKFKDWLYKKEYSDNYVSSIVSRLKAVCNKSGIPLHPRFKEIKTYQSPKKDIIILSQEEQTKISGLKLNDELDNARRWLLLGCQLGQRGGDLLNVREYSVINGVRIIEIVQEKTGKKVAVPVNDKAWEILKTGFPTPIKLYRFNKLLKTIAYRAGIKRWKEVSSHVMRRSFATNYYGKIPTPILMKITGHGKESTFMAYVGRTSLDNAFEAAEWFKRLDGL
jgi:integrase